MSLKNLLKKILPPENTEFFANFIEAANIAKETADLYLSQLTNNLGKDISQEVSLKEKSAVIVKNTYTMLNNSFITPIDREDIIYMSFALNKITKRIFRGIMSSKLYNLKEIPPSMTEQAKNLILATDKFISCFDRRITWCFDCKSRIFNCSY